MWISLKPVKKCLRARGDEKTYRGQVGKDRDDEQWDGIEETDQKQQQEADRSVSNQLCGRFVEILPDLRFVDNTVSSEGS